MRRARREGGGGEIAMMAVITKAMGAFLVIMLMLLPSYVGGRKAADDVEEEIRKAQAQIEQATQQMDQAAAQAAAQGASGELTPQEAADLRKKLEAARLALENALAKIAELEARIDTAENEVKRLQAETEQQKVKIAELEEKQKFLVEEAMLASFDFTMCQGWDSNDFDIVTKTQSANEGTNQPVHWYSADGAHREIEIRGLRAGDILEFMLARHGAAQSGSPCSFAETIRYKHYTYRRTIDVPANGFLFFVGNYKITDTYFENANVLPQDLADANKVVSESDRWKDFLTPDMAIGGDLAETPKTDEIMAAYNESGKSPVLIGHMLRQLVHWSRISPEAAEKRLAALDKPYDAAAAQTNREEALFGRLTVNISPAIAAKLKPLVKDKSVSLSDLEKWAPLFAADNNPGEAPSWFERRSLRGAMEEAQMPEPLQDIFVAAVGVDFSLETAQQRLAKIVLAQ